MSDDLEQLKRHPSAIRLFTERVRLKKDGKEMIGLCCFHSEKSPSLRVFERDGILLFKCFGCGKTGNVIQFVSEHDKIPFNAALKKCREFLNQSWESTREKVEATFKPFAEETKTATKTISLSQYAQFEQALERNDAAQQFLLKERGISYETARKLRLGYRHDIGSIGGDALADVRDRGWIVFPRIIGDCVGGIHYRSLARKAFARQPGMGTFLFNLPTVEIFEPVILVEGEIDCLTFEQAGFRSVSLPNAQTPPSVDEKQALLGAECVILAGDSDEAGNKMMHKLWREMAGRAYMLRWPDGVKDANQFFLENCKRDVSVFRTKIGALITDAKSRPIPNVVSLPESMGQSNWTTLSDHPDRLRFPWVALDSMVNILPGAVLNITATQTGMGKTALLMNILTYLCKRGETVLNYSAELTTEEYSNIVAAHVLRKDRTDIDISDMKRAASLIAGFRFYIGRNPDAVNSDEVLDLIDKAIPILGVSTVAIDHLHHICQGKDNDIKDQNEAAIKIKNIADRHKVKIIVISQPRKSDSKNKGREIHITDIKGGGGIADAADAVIAMHREFIKTVDPANPPDEPYESLTKIRLLKGRSQGKGKAFAELMFLGSFATFSEIAYNESASGMFG